MLEKFRKIRILIADDHYIMRKTTKDMLKMLGYENVTLAESGHEAFSIIEERYKAKDPIHLVISDWMMDDGLGIELVYNIKNSSLFYNIPVIMITGEAMRNNISRALQYGVDSYLIKPFQGGELDKTLDILLNRYAYPDEDQQFIFNGEKLFLAGNFKEALSFFVKVYQNKPTQKYAHKIFRCLVELGEKSKAERLLLQHIDSEFLPIVRELKKMQARDPETLTQEQYRELLKRKIDLEWEDEGKIEDTIELSDIYFEKMKDAHRSYILLKESPASIRKAKGVSERIEKLEERFPFLKEGEAESDSGDILNRGIRYINDMRMQMRKLKNSNSLSDYIAQLDGDLEYFPDNGDWMFELGVALLETGEVPRALDLISKAVMTNPSHYNADEIRDYIDRFRN
jgi:two-component system, chemotaxis family, chemotaxis protein CheY